MRLIECYVENFGRISNRKFIFDRGLNPIREDNGSGKTTLAVFIKVMLFGMGDSKRTRLDENDRRHYLPWGGGRCGGSLTVEVGGRRYRIEREFGKRPSQDSFTLYDAEMGRVSSDYSERIGEELFGIDADGFERSMFLSERGLLPEEGADRLTAKLTDLSSTEDDMRELEGAMAILERQRRRYTKKGGGGEIAELESRISALERKIDGLAAIEADKVKQGEELVRLSDEIARARDERSALTSRRASEAVSAGAGQEVRYAALKEELERDERELGSLCEFFGGRIPTHGELDAVAEKQAEATRLCRAEDAECGSEYQGLCEYFDGRCDPAAVERAERALESLTGGGEPAAEGRRSEATALREELVRAKAGRGGKVALPMILIGLALCIAGAALGYKMSSLLYILAAFGGAIALIGFILLPRRRQAQKYKEVWGRVTKFLGIWDIDRARAAAELEKIASASDESYDHGSMSVIYEFISAFPPDGAPDAISMARRLTSDFRRMERLGREACERREDRRAEGERLMGEVRDFLAPFGTVSQDRIPEIRRALAKYEYVSEAIAEKNRVIRDFANLHGIRESRTDSVTDELIRSLEGRISALEREYALTDERYKDDLRRLDEGAELRAELSSLRERQGRLSAELAVLQTTARLLTEARDGMAAAYLGQMRESFERYSEMLGDAGGEVVLDTSFAISVNERGATRPVEAYSRGRRELYRIITRLSLIDALYVGEKPPLILDDPFTSLDDGRVRGALLLLSRLAETRQIIYLTCSESRMP